MDKLSSEIINKIEWLFEEIDRANKWLRKKENIQPNRDYILVPIERKGVRTLQLSEKGKELVKEGKVLYYDCLFHHIDEIRNKNVFIFDEAVMTGESLMDKTKRLKNINRHKKLGATIWSVALIIRNDSIFKPSIYPKGYLVSRNQFDKLESRLLYLILAEGYPLDTDHPMITIKIPANNEFESFTKVLENIGNVYELPYSGHFGNTRFITIETKEKYKVSTYKPFPTMYNDGVNKVRLYIKQNKNDFIIRCVPILFPSLKFDREEVANCKLRNKFGDIAFCNLMSGDKWKYEDETRCFNCVIYHLNISLISWFLSHLRKNSIEYTIIDYGDFRAFYPKIGKKLREHVEYDITHTQNGELEIQESLLDMEFEEKASNENKYIKDFEKTHIRYLWPNLSIMMKIGLILEQNKYKNKNFISIQGDNEEDKKPLTFSQIVNLLEEELPIKKISIGLDQILDYGLAKPINFKYLYDVKNDKSILSRGYQTAGEDVDKTLNMFYTSEEDKESGVQNE